MRRDCKLWAGDRNEATWVWGSMDNSREDLSRPATRSSWFFIPQRFEQFQTGSDLKHGILAQKHEILFESF